MGLTDCPEKRVYGTALEPLAVQPSQWPWENSWFAGEFLSHSGDADALQLMQLSLEYVAIWTTLCRDHFRSSAFESRNWVVCERLGDLAWTLQKKKSCQCRLFPGFRPSLIGYCKTPNPCFPHALNYEPALPSPFCPLSIAVGLDLEHPIMKAS